MDGPSPLTDLAVLTSGGDAPGMNAAVRAVVRSGLARDVRVHLVTEGYEGLVAGGERIREATSRDVGGILHRGGTVIGSARSEAFRQRDGRRRAARNLVSRGVDALVVIGGDGSLTGADIFRREWPEHLADLVAAGELAEEAAAAHPHLRLVGLVGSIDNDMFGTDMTIGADTALHRITEAVDAIHATAASHQRTFVIEVMGRNCGYLALMGALATGANWVFIPEHPPQTDDWCSAMCDALRAGRASGRRQNLVVLAEGAHDRDGAPITADQVKQALEERLGEDTRVTILGHVQRGGSPSAFDRTLASQLGYAAVDAIARLGPDDDAELIGIREHQIVSSPLMDAIERTHAVADRIAAGDHDGAMALRGGSFSESFRILRTMIRAQPRPRPPGHEARTFAILHAGGPAPGMNTVVRIAVRLGIDRGHRVLGVQNGYAGLHAGAIDELDWMSVSGWVSWGGAELGTSRYVPDVDTLPRIADQLRSHGIDGLLVVGGWAGYAGAHVLHRHRDVDDALAIPIVCIPTTISNDVPGSELSIGADTALNSIVRNVDQIKQSAVATRRSFVVEVMGGDSGYLALMSGLATGAERVYLPEDGITLDQLRDDVHALSAAFRTGQRVGLLIRNEHADPVYTTSFIRALFEKESGDLFDVRESILGHLQQGGDPSPFDRIQATRLAAIGIEHLIAAAERGGAAAAVAGSAGAVAGSAGAAAGSASEGPLGVMIGLQRGRVTFTDLERFHELAAPDARRPADEPWLALRELTEILGLARSR